MSVTNWVLVRARFSYSGLNMKAAEIWSTFSNTGPAPAHSTVPSGPATRC